MLRQVLIVALGLIVLGFLYTVVIPSLPALAVAPGATHENDSNAIDLPAFVPPDDPDSPPASSGGSLLDVQPLGGSSGASQTDDGSSDSGSGTSNTEAVLTLSLGAPSSSSGVEADGSGSEAGFLTSLLEESGAISISSGGSSGSGGVSIFGDAVRGFFAGEGIEEIRFQTWDPVSETFVPGVEPTQVTSLSERETSLIAAAAVLEDSRIESVDISGPRITMQYRTSGRIAALIPISFILGIVVDGAAPEGLRTDFSYPWYRWFMWLTVPRAELRGSIELAIQNALTVSVDAKDAEARVFTATVRALKEVHRRYEGGIRIVL